MPVENPATSANGHRPPPTSRIRLGGMALRNGLLVHGPEHWAVAVRANDGRIAIGSGAKLRLRGKLADLPGVRGIARLVEAFAVVPMARRAVSDARLPFEDPKVVMTMAGSSAAAALVRRAAPPTLRRESLIALLGSAPAVVALTGSELASYHGVEHKVIAAYEQGKEPESVPKEHVRCGSTLVVPMAVTTIAGNLVARSVLRVSGPAVGAAVALAATAASVEMFAWSERHGDTALARAFRWPGLEIQRLFATREPTAEQVDVAKAAMAEVLRLEAE